MDAVSIDWSSVDVSPPAGMRRDYELRVALDGEADAFWVSAFREICARSSGVLDPSHDWWIRPPEGNVGRWMTVGGIKPGFEDEVKARLQELVTEANARAPEDRRVAEEERQRQDREYETDRVVARQMADRFREH
jgi:hypothetical protein